MRKITAVIPAAGIGKRMLANVPKQYLEIADKPILQHTIEAFLSFDEVNEIVVVISPNDTLFNDIPEKIRKRVHCVHGGAERYDSVLAGITFAYETLNSDWVMVHDAARPGVSNDIIQRLIESTENTNTGAIAALPAVDTIKQSKPVGADKSHTASIEKTIDRAHVWSAQTPQFFPAKRLISAITTAMRDSIEITDEASAVEYIGEEVLLVQGSQQNFKVTKPEDLSLMAFYFQQREDSKK